MSGPRENLEGLSDLSDDERRLERLLAELAPRDSRMQRDVTMFRAGQASALPSRQWHKRRFGRWVWPAGTICSAAAGIVVGILLSASNPRVEGLLATPTTNDAITRRAAAPAKKIDRDDEGFAGESPAALEIRVRRVNRAGDEFLLAQADPLVLTKGRATNPARAERPLAPVTYREFMGRSLEKEGHE
jgi:hypothetical protein